MKNAKAENKKKFSGKIAGLTVLEALFYILSLPVIVVLSAVFCVKTYELVPYYSFWPFVGVILAGVLCLVFVIVVMCISLRKKSKRTILMQTVSIIVAAVMLTSFIAVALDVVLPDVLAQLTSSTLFYEDVSNEGLASEQAEFNAGLDRKFIMLNLLNGNYDPQYYYETLKADADVSDRAATLASWIRRSSTTPAVYADTLMNDETRPYYSELFQFIYDEYIMTDITYALLNPDKEGIGNSTRIGMGHAIAEVIYPEYKELVKEGMSNERISELFLNNYASLKNDGYLTFDDSMILYATSGRMTVPVVIRLLLDQGYTYTDGEVAYFDEETGSIVEPEGVFYLELYKPDAVDRLVAATGAVRWATDGSGLGIVVQEVEGVEYGIGAVVIPNRDANGEIIQNGGGYIRAPRTWSILDMDGKRMDVAAISDVVVDLGSLIGGIEGIPQAILDIIPDELMNPMTLGALLDNEYLDGLLDLLIQNELKPVVDQLLQGITDVIMAATGGAALYLNLAINDEGALEIAISPTNVEVGMHGYQYMTWMESNNLLIAVMSVMSLREWLYIFGAVSVLLAFAAGMCREIKARIKKDVEENAALAAETATGESVDAGDAFPMAEGGESGAAETAGAEDTAADVSAAEPADTAPPAEEE